MSLSRHPYGLSSMGVPFPGITGGNVYFVDLENGSDSYRGLNTSYPFRTIVTALLACVSGNGDIIYVMGKGSTTAPISITKDDVHIIGIPATSSPTGGQPRLRDTVHDSIFDIRANKVHIEGIRLHAAESGGKCITIGSHDEACHQITLRNLTFDLTALNGVGIHIVGVLANSTVEEISILTAVPGISLAANGIGTHPAGASLQNIYRDIYIRGDLETGINLRDSTQDVVERIKCIGPTKSIIVVGITSMVTGCKTDSILANEPLLTALLGDNTTVA